MAKLRVPSEVKKLVRERAGYRCEYCRSPESHIPDSLSIEHILPRSLGGDNSERNLALSCQRCNALKFVSIEAPDPLTSDRVGLYHPRLQNWKEQFQWGDERTILVGKTATGRATIEKLKLNRVGVVNLRRLLILVNLHPPI